MQSIGERRCERDDDEDDYGIGLGSLGNAVPPMAGVRARCTVRPVCVGLAHVDEQRHSITPLLSNKQRSTTNRHRSNHAPRRRRRLHCRVRTWWGPGPKIGDPTMAQTCSLSDAETSITHTIPQPSARALHAAAWLCRGPPLDRLMYVNSTCDCLYPLRDGTCPNSFSPRPRPS